MSAVDRSGVVSVSVGGVVQEMPYRRAVGLVATGRATWVQDTVPDAPAPKVRKPREKRVAPPVLPEQVAVPGEPHPPLPESAYGPDAVPLDPPVSAPTIGAEGEETEYLPSPPDQ